MRRLLASAALAALAAAGCSNRYVVIPPEMVPTRNDPGWAIDARPTAPVAERAPTTERSPDPAPAPPSGAPPAPDPGTPARP